MALAAMRRHRRWLYGFLWLVILAFIILYVPALTDEGQGTPAEPVVSVGGLKVSAGEYQRAYNRQRQFYAQLYQGRNLDESMLQQLGLDRQVLESLVTERLVELEAKRLGIRVPDEAVARAVAGSPEFQDGSGNFIGSDEIRRRLDLAGISEADLERSLRQRLERESLEALVGAAVSVSDAEVEREFRRRSEQVRLEYVQAEASRYRDEVEVDDAAIAARFEAKREAYRIPEKRVVAYVLLDRATLAPQVAVTDRELELYYGDNREDFRQDEEACASHILVKVRQGDTGEGHDDAEARALAEKALAELEAGADFAELARRLSEDTGSAAQGGDLGCFGPGRMVPAFDDAVFALEPGQTSGLVRTDFGYHVIRLASRKDSTVMPFAQVKERIRASVTDRKLRELGEQKAEALHAALGRGETLEAAAKAQGLTVQRSQPFARGETPPGLQSPALVARVFEMKPGEAEKEGFPLPQGAAFFSLAEVVPAREPGLEEVKDEVREDLVEEGALERARAAVAGVRERALARGLGLEKAAAAASLVRKETPSLTGHGQPLGDLGSGLSLEQAAFSLPEQALSEPVRTPAGWAVLRVLEKKPFDKGELEQQAAQIRASLRQQRQSELFRAFLMSARERYTIERYPEAFRRVMGLEQ